MIDINELRRLAQAATPGPWKAVSELLDRLEAAEAEALEEARLNGMGSEREAALLAKLEAAEKERDWHAGRCEDAMNECAALRAKIEAMERQEPVGEIQRANSTGNYICSEVWVPLPVGSKLYALPGAQPAPSVPDGFSREDLEAVADGLDGYEKTVNVGNVTGEGDDHLESTTAYAARFIRTMLAAAPEAKP